MVIPFSAVMNAAQRKKSSELSTLDLVASAMEYRGRFSDSTVVAMIDAVICNHNRFQQRKQ